MQGQLFLVDGFSWPTPGAERCSASSWTSGVQTPEPVACQSGLAWARRPRRLMPLPRPSPQGLLERAPARCAWRRPHRGKGVPRPLRRPRGTRRCCLRASVAIQLSKPGTCLVAGGSTVQREVTSPSWRSSCPRWRGCWPCPREGSTIVLLCLGSSRRPMWPRAAGSWSSLFSRSLT